MSERQSAYLTVVPMPALDADVPAICGQLHRRQDDFGESGIALVACHRDLNHPGSCCHHAALADPRAAANAKVQLLGEHLLDCQSCQVEIGPGCPEGERLLADALAAATAAHESDRRWRR